MKNRYIKFICVLVVVISGMSVKSQPWLHATYNDLKSEIDTLDIFQKFELYWTGRSYEKGKGFKQFKRWQFMLEPRLYPNLQQVDNSLYQRYYSHYSVPRSRATVFPAWSLVGPVSPSESSVEKEKTGMGRMNCIQFHPTKSGVLYAGAPSGGLWSYSDITHTWSVVNDDLPSIGVSDILINPTNADEIYILTGDGDAGDTYTVGVLKSTDGGATFSSTVLGAEPRDEAIARRLIAISTDGLSQIATTSNGIYKTDDGWETGNKVQNGHFKDIEQSPGNAKIIYAAKYTDDSQSAGIFRSIDGGDSFDEVNFAGSDLSNISRIEISTSVSSPTVAYAVCANKYDGGFYALYRTDNSGSNWTKVTQSLPINLFGWTLDGTDAGGQAWYDLAIAVHPDDANMLFVGAVNIWKSTDGGKSWQYSSDWMYSNADKYVHADIHDLRFGASGQLYACHDGGVSVSKDNGVSWTDMSEGLSVTQIYRMDVDNDRYIFGSQDNGTSFYNRWNWDWILSGDGMGCALDSENSDIIYGSYYNGEIHRSLDAALSFENITPNAEFLNGTPQGAWVTPFIIDHHTPKVLYAGYGKVYKSLDRGSSWLAISSELDPYNKLTVLKQSASNPLYLLAGSINGLWLTVDGGSYWKQIDTGLPDFAITDVDFAFNDANKFWVTFSGYTSERKVYFTDNAGASWSNYSKGLPNLPINAIVAQAKSNKALYAGTDLGVYYRNASMDKWELYSVDLPACIINQLQVSGSELYAATFGRGLWKAPVYSDSSANWYVDFASDYQSVCADVAVNVTFSNTSSVDFDSLFWDFGNYAQPKTARGIGPHSVAFPNKGSYTVSLTGYKSGKVFQESKYNYIKAVDELVVVLDQATHISCGQQVELEILTGGSFNWHDTLHDLSFDGNVVSYVPTFSSVFKIDASQGTCSGIGYASVSFVADNICDAEVIGYGLYGPFSNSCGDVEYSEPIPDTLRQDACTSQNSWCSEGGVQKSVWFQFDPGTATQAYIKAPGFDNQIALYSANSCADIVSGNDNLYTILAANDDYEMTDNSAVIEFVDGLSSKNKYWIQVDGSGGGETGIFTLDIRQEPPLTAKFTADTNFIFPGNQVFFTNESFGKATNWEWKFSGGNPSFSFARNPPSITYEQEGLFGVELIIRNDTEQDSLIVENFIQVGNPTVQCDSVTNFVGTPELYELNVGGFLSGNNSFGDRAKAESFDFSASAVSGYEIDWVDITFGHASGEQSMITVVVWDDASNRPGNSLVKIPVPISDIVSDVFFNRPTRVYIDPPVQVKQKFYVGIELPQSSSNVVAINTNRSDEAVTNTAWDLWTNGQWGMFSEKFNLMIGANICKVPTPIDNFMVKPVPVIDVLQIDLGNFDGIVNYVDVLSVQGERMAHHVINVKYTRFSIDLSSIASGIYFIQIDTDQGRSSKKIVKN